MARGSIKKRLTSKGLTRYDAQLREPDGRKRKRTFKLKADAESWLNTKTEDVRDGSYRRLKPATFAQYLEKWRTNRASSAEIKPSTLASWDSIIRKRLLSEFGGFPIARIDAEMVSGFRARLLAEVAAQTARNVLALLSLVCKGAIKDGYLTASPMAGVDLPKREEERAGRELTA